MASGPRATVIRVLNMRTDDVTGAEYIGRPSPLGNPYRIRSAGGEFTREESLAFYARFLEQRLAIGDPEITAEIDRLLAIARAGALDLACWCNPLPCHGDVIKRVLEDALEDDRLGR